MRSRVVSGLSVLVAVRCLAAVLAVVCVVSGVGAGSAAALTPGAGLAVHSFALPSHFSAASASNCENQLGSRVPCDAYQVTVTNTGSEPTDGSPIVLSDALPAGLGVRKIEFLWSTNSLGSDGDLSSFLCSTAAGVTCELPFALAPDAFIELVVYVSVDPSLTGPSVTNTANVSGGGVAGASASESNPVSSTPAAFGLESFGAGILGVDGTPDTRAGGHPYELTTRIDLNTEFRIGPQQGFEATSVQDLKDAVVDLPLGFLGSVLATPQCTLAQLGSRQGEGCPADTRVGHIFSEPTGPTGVDSGVFNMVPEHGVAAEFGYRDGLFGTHFLYASVVPTPRGYVLRTTAPDLPQVSLTDVVVTFYGNPAAKDETGNAPVAFFTNPADCSGGPLSTTVHADSWQRPGRLNADGTPDLSDPNWVSSGSESPPVTGCDRLRFDPSLSARPETTTADSPTGLEVDLKVPQSQELGTLATPPLRDAKVTLPAGLTLNPAAAGGLGACSEAQIGLGSAAPPTCPESSRIGTVEVQTPAVAGTLQGSIYLARQNENPFHSLLAGYIVIDDPTTGVVVKIPGDLTPDPSTGQITGVFNDNPQLPFSDLRLHFFGGARGELATPTGCGTYTTTSDLMPWSAPDSGPDATPFSSFPIDTGCTSGFNPSFTAGTENPQAAGYSPFVLSLSRADGEQNLAGVAVTLPPGLLGKIAGIPLCPDANANAGTCPEASLLGSVQVSAGAGPNPFFVGGKAYLTGPYNGGAYGLVVEVPAVAGPFNLGTVVVRQSLRIDPHTAQVTAVSDPFPTILQGIPLRVRRVDVTLDRPGFTFNPTNCTQLAIAGAVTSTEGASANVSSRFQAGGCRELAFKPSFTVSTQAMTSKKNGASLDVKVGYPQGAQANIRGVAVTLPKQLPSRLTTIQQACPEATFNANPASCPAGSVIGTATAHTPVLATPVTGPAYLVSHGGAAFPDLVLILQGEGVKLELVGSIDIKHGVTRSAFNAVPDAPISSFELKLPEGPHSGLAAVLPAKAKGNVCGTRLVMPTTLTGQNGAQIKQSTKIAVTGCAKAKKTHKAKHSRRKAKKHKKQ
jgi:hypothetical protein